MTKTAFKAFENFRSKVRGDQRIWNQALLSPLWYRFFSKVVLTIPRRFQTIKKEFLNLSQSLSSDKNGIQGIWKFSVKGKGGPKDLKSGPVVPPLVSIFFKSGSNYPETLSNNQKGVSELKPITFIWQKRHFKAFENFRSKVRGDQRIWNQALWSLLWYRFFSKVVLTIPRRFQTIKKEFLNLSQSLSSDKNGIQGIWKFSVKGKGGAKGFEIRPCGPPLVSIFFKSGSNYPETLSNNQKGVSELKPITFIWQKRHSRHLKIFGQR